MMLGRLITIAISVSVLGTASVCAAQPRAQGQLALSADRLFGYSYSKTNYDELIEVEVTGSHFSLMGGSGVSNFNVPRGSIDYFVTDGLSIGGSLAYVSTSLETEALGQESDNDGSVFVIAPRVGYATMFSPAVGIWPRGGFTYMSADQEDVDVNAFALTIEVPLLLAPSEHLAITLGPTLDYALSASAEVAGEDADLSLFDFGLMVGLAGFI